MNRYSSQSFARDRDVELGGAEIKEGYVEAAAVEGDDRVVARRNLPEGGEEFDLVGAGDVFHGAGFVGGVLAIFGEEEHLAAAGLGIDHGDADDLSGEGPKAELALNLGAAGLALGAFGQALGVAKRYSRWTSSKVSGGRPEVSISKTRVAIARELNSNGRAAQRRLAEARANFAPIENARCRRREIG